MTWTEPEIAWVAGLLEGEGSFMTHTKNTPDGYTYPAFRVSCNMTDEDVLVRLSTITGMGHLVGPTIPQNPLHSPFWRWGLYKKADILRLCLAILPYMGKRRSEKIRLMIDTIGTTRFWKHGTRWGYERGCRCDACRAAFAKHHRDRRAKRKQESVSRES